MVDVWSMLRVKKFWLYLETLAPQYSWPLFRLFSDFLNFNTMLQQKVCKIIHKVYSTGIQTHNLLGHKSPPITTRPGLCDLAILYLINGSLLPD